MKIRSRENFRFPFFNPFRTRQRLALGAMSVAAANGDLSISCRNRHCPKCQSGARDRWIAARQSELLPVPYIHVVFTVPHHLAHLALVNKKVFYDLLFHATAQTLLEVAADPEHLGAQIGFLAVLHSWGQNLLFHPHLHCLIPAGGLSLDHTRWIHPRYPFFLPVGVLRRVFRGKFVDALKRRFQQRQLIFPGSLRPLQNEKAFRAFLRPLFRHNWVVYAKPPFGGPHHVLGYLARYTHRVAISNHRLVAFANNQVTFRWRDSYRTRVPIYCHCCRPATYFYVQASPGYHLLLVKRQTIFTYDSTLAFPQAKDLRIGQAKPIAPPRPPQTPAASSKSPYRKCPAGHTCGLTRLHGADAFAIGH